MQAGSRLEACDTAGRMPALRGTANAEAEFALFEFQFLALVLGPFLLKGFAASLSPQAAKCFCDRDDALLTLASCIHTARCFAGLHRVSLPSATCARKDKAEC